MIQSYPWYIADWRESETRISLSLAERGLYRELLDYCYLEGSLPKDQTRLSRLAGCSPKEFSQSWGPVSKLFDEDGDRLTHRKVNEVKAKVLKYHEQKKHAGAASGRSRRERSLNVRSFVAQTRVEPAPAPAPSPTPSHETQTLFAAEAAESEIPKHPESVVRPNVPTKRRKSNRSTAEIKRDLGPERLSWWEGFWKEYPCHEGMNAAMSAFEVKINDRDTAASAWKAARAYSAKFSADPEMKLKYGQGWINEERWLDEIRPPANGTHGVSGSDPRNLDGYQELR